MIITVPPARQIAPALVARENWPADFLDRSVTELEIQHGVLSRPEPSGSAFFYFRRPTPGQAPDPRMDALKVRIRTQFHQGLLQAAPREGYANPEVLGQAIREDFTGLINRLFPKHEKPDWQTKESATHLTFARNRAQIYIARKHDFDLLDAHVAADSPPLAVLGQSGIGKSALLANWFLRYRDSHPGSFAFIHFAGAGTESACPLQIVRRILSGLQRRYPGILNDELPTGSDELRDALPVWIGQIAAAFPHERFVLIIDGLNQLEDQDLGWLPRFFPNNFRGHCLDSARTRS